MIKTFHNIQLKSFALSLLIGVLFLFSLVFVREMPEVKDLGTLANWFLQIEAGSRVYGLFLIILGGLLLQRVVSRNEIIFRQSTLTLFFYLILHSLLPANVVLSTFSILSFLSILIFTQLLRFYSVSDPGFVLFFASFLVGLGSWLFFPFLLFQLVVFFAFARFNPLSLRVFILGILGFLFVWIITFTAQYINPNWLLGYKINIAPCTSYFSNFKVLIPASVLILLFSFSILSWLQNAQRNTVKVRRNIQTIFFYMSISTLLGLAYFCETGNSVQLIYVPGSILLAYFFSIIKKYKIRLLLFYALLLTLLFAQFSTFIKI